MKRESQFGDEVLQDSARSLLLCIAADMRTKQTISEQIAKSKGERPRNAPAITEATRAHAADRLDRGFALREMVSEFRAADERHSCWLTSGPPFDGAAVAALTRFNESVGQALMESVSQYSKMLEHIRDLFVGVLARVNVIAMTRS